MLFQVRFLASIGLTLVLSGCAVINQPRCRAGIQGFEPWPHQGDWQSGRTTLPYSAWLPQRSKHPRAVVILVQGWDSSGRDYDSIGRRLAREGFAVYASENRCGKYDSNILRRGATPSSERDWVDDLKHFTATVRDKHPGLPVFYHGHSMGCLVAIEAVSEAAGVEGLILHSPGFPLMSDRAHPIRDALLLPIFWVRAPHLLLVNPKKNAPFEDPEVNCRWLKSKDRVRRGYQIGFLLRAAALGHDARLHSRELTLPVLALGGGNDRISTFGTKTRTYRDYLSKEVAGGHAEVVFYPEGYHVLTEGSTRDQALDVIVNWLDSRCR